MAYCAILDVKIGDPVTLGFALYGNGQLGNKLLAVERQLDPLRSSTPKTSAPAFCGHLLAAFPASFPSCCVSSLPKVRGGRGQLDTKIQPKLGLRIRHW